MLSVIWARHISLVASFTSTSILRLSFKVVVVPGLQKGPQNIVVANCGVVSFDSRPSIDPDPPMARVLKARFQSSTLPMVNFCVDSTIRSTEEGGWLMRQVRHLFLTGEPGIGKSSLVRRLLQRLGGSVAVNGFTTMEITGDDGAREGFQSINVADPAHTARLATRRKDGASRRSEKYSGCRVGPYEVHIPETIEFMQCALKKDTREAVRSLTVLDEVGKMQSLCGASFDDLVTENIGPCSAHDSAPCLGTIPPEGLHALDLVDYLRSREDVAVWEVTAENRVELLEKGWLLLTSALYPTKAAQKIAAKRALAARYLEEFDDRVQYDDGDDDSTMLVHFRGDHSQYTIRGLASHSPKDRHAWRINKRICSCPFYGQWQTCSHILTLSLRKEEQERRLFHQTDRSKHVTVP